MPPLLSVPKAEAQEITERVWTPEEQIALATSEAKKHNLNVDHFIKTLADESSGWQYKTQSQFPVANGPNGKENSWGTCQIFLDAHPEITREQAQDPAFCIPWTAEQWQAGNYRQWHSYSKLEKLGWPDK